MNRGASASVALGGVNLVDGAQAAIIEALVDYDRRYGSAPHPEWTTITVTFPPGQVAAAIEESP